MESDAGGRLKKIAWAVEAEENEALGRPRCESCSDRLREKRGCFRPGYSVPGKSRFRFTSPLLLDADGNEVEADMLLAECPRGRVLREAPHVYDAIGAYGLVEAGPSLDVLYLPLWLQQAFSYIGGEKARMRELNLRTKKAALHADIGAKARGA